MTDWSLNLYTTCIYYILSMNFSLSYLQSFYYHNVISLHPLAVPTYLLSARHCFIQVWMLTFSTNSSHQRDFWYLPDFIHGSSDWTRIRLSSLCVVHFSLIFCLFPRGRLSWLPVSVWFLTEFIVFCHIFTLSYGLISWKLQWSKPQDQVILWRQKIFLLHKADS